MAAPTNYYVDPSSGDDFIGDGSSGNPWASVAHALGGGATRDSTNGDQINIKSSASDTSAGVDPSGMYGNPTSAAPLIIRGYTSSANDGGIGVLDGSSSAIISTTSDFVNLVDLRFTNSGSSALVTGNNNWSVMRCQFDNTTGNALDLDDDARIVNCYFKDIGGVAIFPAQRTFIRACTFHNDGGGKEFTNAVTAASTSGWMIVEECIFKLTGASVGVTHGASSGYLEVRNCSFYSVSGTGAGVTGDLSFRVAVCVNNLVEGFSGSGGYGIRLRSWEAITYGNNAAYNNATNYNITSDTVFDLGDNEALSASPYTNPGSNDFTPVDTGNVLGGSYPTSLKGFAHTQSRDKGAIQKASSGGGGGGSRRSRIRTHN
tara:strand:- start:224 stop:1345 length:1122 start_codon:yes stop_codon:yes gene_type:complete